MATIHAEVPDTTAMDKAHDVIDQIERDAKEELGILLVIHMDPVAVDDEQAMAAKKTVLDELKKLDEKGTIHDFRMVKGEEESKLIFDLVVPHDYSVTKENDLIDRLKEKVQEVNGHYECLITLEHSYVEERNTRSKKIK